MNLNSNIHFRRFTPWIVFVYLFSFSAHAENAENNPQPNILLIIADDMGLDASACYSVGNAQAPMPVLESLCKKGLVFDRAYAYPVCSPTRSALMTGQPATETGIGSAVRWRSSKPGLSGDYTSIFDSVSKKGYSTAVVGKWHLATQKDGLNHPIQLGVSEYFGLYRGAIKDYFKWTAVENGREVAVNEYATTALTDRAANWLEAQNSPWFLWLAYNAPHAPFHKPPNHLHQFAGLQDQGESPSAYYPAMLQAMDTEIGRLLEGLDSETRENTIIIFMGDNGTPNQVAASLYSPNGAKGSLFEGGVHVPLIITGPNIPAGRTNALVQPEDVHATIIALAGAKNVSDFGLDQRSVFTQKNTIRHAITISQFSDSPPKGPDTYGWMIRDDKTALVVIDDKPKQLFNLTEDPFERTNLLVNPSTQNAEKQANALESMRKALVH